MGISEINEQCKYSVSRVNLVMEFIWVGHHSHSH